MEERNNGSRKTLLFIFILLYVLSPVDAAPGPLDDIAVMLIPLIMG